MRDKVLPWLLAGLATLFPPSAVTAGPSDAANSDEQLPKAAGVGADGPALLDFFRRSTLTGADQDRIQTLIRQLGDEDYAQREKASAELLTLGSAALPKLREAAKDRDPEIAYRA